MQIVFSALVFLIPAVLAFFVWRDVWSHRQREQRKGWNLLLFSAVALSCNILLLYFWYVGDLLFMRGHPISQAGVSEYKFVVLVLWASRMAVLISLATVITALLSERGLARKLCIWGSVAGLICWPVLNVAASELVTVYLLHHR
jgi:hypothetical protein